MNASLRILMVEDSAHDAELVIRALRKSGFELTSERVDTPEAMRTALESGPWDVVLSDYSMPRFDGLAALKMLHDKGFDLPFILVSGVVGEDAAVQAMKAGAHDYVLKSNLIRLPFAIERELRDAETRREAKSCEVRYRNLFDRIPVGVSSTTNEGRLLDVNPAFTGMLGFANVEAAKQANIADFWLKPEERIRLLALLARDGVVQNFETQFRRTDGTVVWGEIGGRAVYRSTGEVDFYEGVFVDITARKRSEEELTRARDLALETVRLRLEFVQNVNHELRTPLHQVLGMSEVLLGDDLGREQREEVEVIQSSGELLLAIVDDILDFSKLSAGKVVLEKVDFNLVDLMKGVIDSFAEAARAKKVALALSLDANLPAALQGDPNRLRQILRKLVSNAIKFTSTGEVLVRATRAEEAAGAVLITFEVIDTGIGIPPELHSRMFQPFVQADGSNTRRYGGTGLGLVISALLVEQMRGEIGFESTPGKGSNFHFTVRLAKEGAVVLHAMTASAG